MPLMEDGGTAVAYRVGAEPSPLKTRLERLGRSSLLLVAVILALALIRLFVAANAGLTDDEAYYRLWALAPAMSYLDHPPMVGWMIAAGRWIVGDTPLGIRLGAVLASLVIPFVLWRTVHLLFDPQTARRATWTTLAMPLLAVGGVIATPDTPSVLFWALTIWALAELHASRHASWWLAVGVFAGLGLLSKYTNLFVGASIVLWLLAVPANRVWFRAWQLWAGGLVAGALTLPVVMWNAENGWISFAKQFGRVGHGRQFTAAYLAELAGAFLGLASPLIAVLSLLGLWMVVRSTVASRNSSRTLIAASILPLLAYFLVHALHDRVQPNWMAPIYPSFAVCAAIALTTIARSRKRLSDILSGSGIAVGLAMSGLIYLHALVPLVQIPGLKDPSSQMRGWPELATEVERMRASTGACSVVTSSYATTGQLAYALKDIVPVAQLNEPQRYLHLPAIDLPGRRCPVLYVELERRSSAALLHARFQSISLVGTLTRSDRGVPIARYPVYLTTEPSSPR